MTHESFKAEFTEIAYEAVRAALKEEIRAMASRELILLKNGEANPVKAVGHPSVLLKMFGHYQATVDSIANFPKVVQAAIEEQGETT